ncbi:MAG: flagellar basal body L-ring protein FlgH [Arcobacter butzleri]|nr:flagellar basal body L-ring protein FlgH [Aliarcobacter butzleri]
MMKNRYLLLLSLSFLLLFSACSSQQYDSAYDLKQLQVPREHTPKVERKGSLYSVRGGSLFSDKKDLQIGDIIQVRIIEELKSDSKNTRDMKKSNTTNLGAGVFTGVSGQSQGALPKAAINNINRQIGVGFESQSNNTFKGNVTSKFDESLETTVSAVIEEVYQNGNYLIRGSREVTIDGQKQFLFLTGIIRPYDITPDNSVLSDQVANLRIFYDKTGEEANTLHKGWGTRFLEGIWPF